MSPSADDHPQGRSSSPFDPTFTLRHKDPKAESFPTGLGGTSEVPLKSSTELLDDSVMMDHGEKAAPRLLLTKGLWALIVVALTVAGAALFIGGVVTGVMLSGPGEPLAVLRDPTATVEQASRAMTELDPPPAQKKPSDVSAVSGNPAGDHLEGDHPVGDSQKPSLAASEPTPAPLAAPPSPEVLTAETLLPDSASPNPSLSGALPAAPVLAPGPLPEVLGRAPATDLNADAPAKSAESQAPALPEPKPAVPPHPTRQASLSASAKGSTEDSTKDSTKDTSGENTLSPAPTASSVPSPSSSPASPVVASSSQAESAPAAAVKKRFTIQAGAFGRESNASNRADALRDLGYEPEVKAIAMSSGRTLHVVLLGYYDTPRAAAEDRQKLRAAGIETALIQAVP